MASGDPVIFGWREAPPGADAAIPDKRPGGSTPAESYPVWDFEDTNNSFMQWECLLHDLTASADIDFKLKYMMSSATSGGVRLRVGIRRANEAGEDLDTSHTYTYTGATDTVPSTNGQVGYVTITVTNANLDSWANGELAYVMVGREPGHAGDTASGDLELVGPPFATEA